ncbi:MAG TPA: T9SS type A sorting domain-containing protein [Chitinophagales bacterium]|nr:T9SS type A sorting domain-containing protein [Chitinophagales bacterium]HNI55150.1 T9SS type A sorting domain-containing protein [Chitinophagales bacterium]HNJ88744.1 T9SS type A sorting domain-containing protein [Chitinophagales bacterium]HNK97493.1 T9SS type A sorting domain-containing protein [Chitinophagales bacterium]HNM07638.1 T9SS type A sorting domain-containing protein [Chitinophagales bacterium]
MKPFKQFTLQQYSGLAGALLFLHGNTSAQAVYTDIEPDVTLQYDDDYVYIDLDGDGSNDYFLLKDSHYFSNTFYEIYRFNHVLYCGPNFNPENSIAGTFATNGEGGGTTYFPYALNSGELINSDLNFQYGHYQLMAIGFYKISVTPWEWHYGIGYWTPNKDSLFLGVRFLGGDDCKHYGWIRCSTADSAKTLIVHDFAYETKCETPIVAGDTIGDTTTVVVNNLLELNAEIFAYNMQLFVRSNVAHQIAIFDSSGKKILDNSRQQGTYNIDMQPFPKGIYIVELTTGSQMLTKIVSL